MEAKGNTVAGNWMPNSKWPPCISSTKFKWHILTEIQRQSQPGEASGQCLSGWKKFQQGCPGCWVCWFETCPKPTNTLLLFSLQHLNLCITFLFSLHPVHVSLYIPRGSGLSKGNNKQQRQNLNQRTQNSMKPLLETKGCGFLSRFLFLEGTWTFTSGYICRRKVLFLEKGFRHHEAGGDKKKWSIHIEPEIIDCGNPDVWTAQTGQ